MTKPIKIKIAGRGGSVHLIDQHFEYGNRNVIRADFTIIDGKLTVSGNELPYFMFPDKITIELEWNPGE